MNKDGFLDWDEYMALMMEARSTFTLGQFSRYDLNGDGEIDQAEMDTVVAAIKESGNEFMANVMRQNFDLMLKNFDANGDGEISIAEFANAIKSLKV